MKTRKTFSVLLLGVISFLLSSCGPNVKVTTWKNPEMKSGLSKVAIMPLFEKVEFIKAFENEMVTCFEKKGLKSVGSLTFLNPKIKYPIDVIKHRCDSLGVDAILLFLYQGTDKSESYVPPTTYYTSGYGGYGGYWGGGYWGGMDGGYGGVVTTEGYWITSNTINLSAKLFIKGSKDPLWTAEVTITDPKYVDQAAGIIGKQIYADWEKENLLKFKEGN